MCLVVVYFLYFCFHFYFCVCCILLFLRRSRLPNNVAPFSYSFRHFCGLVYPVCMIFTSLEFATNSRHSVRLTDFSKNLLKDSPLNRSLSCAKTFHGTYFWNIYLESIKSVWYRLARPCTCESQQNVPISVHASYRTTSCARETALCTASAQ
jgi:hypothetical protein